MGRPRKNPVAVSETVTQNTATTVEIIAEGKPEITAEASQQAYDKAIDKYAEEPTEAKDTIIPKTYKNYSRNSYGLLSGVEYKFNEDGSVNWRAMLKPEHLVLNRQNPERLEKKYEKKVSEIDIAEDKVEDCDLLILLGGIKELAKLRGYTVVRYNPLHIAAEFCSIACIIRFIPNYEVPEGLEFEDVADAHAGNTKGFGTHYLSSMAANRAFQRAVRNALGIHIVAKDEVGVGFDSDDSESKIKPGSPHAALQSQLEARGKTLKDVKNGLLKKDDKGLEEINLKREDIEKWANLEDIPKMVIFHILSKLKTKNGDSEGTNGKTN